MRPEDLLSTWKTLRADYDAGRLDWDALVKACADLRTRDAEGRWWTVDAAGRLLVWDDARRSWDEATPAPSSPPSSSPPPAAAPGEPSKPRSRRSEATPAAAKPAADEAEHHRHARRATRDAEDAAVAPRVAAPAAGPSTAPPAARAAVAPAVDRLAPPVRVKGTSPPSATAEAASPPEPLAARAKASATMFGLAFLLSLAISWLGWSLLAVVPLAINGVIPTGSCTGFQPASIGMYLCSALVGLRVVFGSLVLAVVMVILRKPIMAAVGLINKAVPEAFRSVLPAVVAAVFFAVVWSGSHAATGDLKGILPHRAFPALVAVFVQATMVWGPTVMARLSLVFRARDVLPKLFRWVLVVLVPMAFSLWITAEDRVSNEAYKQQLVVLVGMAAAWVLMTPRSGRLADLQSDLGAGLAAVEARRNKAG